MGKISFCKENYMMKKSRVFSVSPAPCKVPALIAAVCPADREGCPATILGEKPGPAGLTVFSSIINRFLGDKFF
jgi:hypothetical protein